MAKNDAAKIIFIQKGTVTSGTAVFSAKSAKKRIRKEAGAIIKSAAFKAKNAAVSEKGIRNWASVTKGTDKETVGIAKKFTKGEATEKVPEIAVESRMWFIETETQTIEITNDFGITLQILRTVATQRALIMKLRLVTLPGIRSAVKASEQKKTKTGWGKVPEIIKKSKKSMKTSERRVGIEAPVMKK